MDAETVRAEFTNRYYRWALEDFRREIEDGFPFLGKFNSGSIWHVRDMMSGMTRDEQLLFANVLVKRFHQEAVERVGDELTTEEVKLCNHYLDRAPYPSPVEFELEQQVKEGRGSIYANRAQLRRAVQRELQMAGMQILEQEALLGVLSYQNIIDGWKIITRVHTGERNAQLAYEHSIWSVKKVTPVMLHDGQRQMWPVQLHSWISLAGWLGVSSRTEWRALAQSDGSRAAKDLSVLCRHFLDAGPRLLSGLSV